MMQAFLIMTRDINKELLNLVEALDSFNHTIFIHVDKKSGDIDSETIKNVAKKSDIVFVPRIKVTWGGFSIVQAELSLIKNANVYGKFDHFHLLSGEDFPVKNNEQIDEFFEKNKNKNFLEISDRIPEQNRDRFKLRYQQYHFLQDRFIGQKHNIFKYVDFASCYIQRFIGINRTRKVNIQSGAQWFSLNQELIAYIVEHEKWINKHFKNTYCPDEAFIQTLIADTHFMDTVSEKQNLRYVDFYWKAKHNFTPRFITEKDLTLLKNKNYFFARKFDKNISNLFLKEITKGND
ncbi:beta-1,6-N-acetylglucosaminyltransferase [Pediococcus pentosaceus]|uniref:beta-1,6-N-acetylglucosaminyltransferase n=1 Tax=Pediococcus pentosaceus TaxID=1255 RepID=UPI0018A1359E|nr:beta-1,6-N-acetylglucosaminyltransferase [Pediococcus pentosaceus]MBF7102883.1 glycosyl transferase [Pediococcus pentosaceus]